jgi:diguanylate cyclase (GGDEF)-like protein
VGLLFMDFDGFKAANDTLCRQGGDEFVLLLPQAPDLDGLMDLAERNQSEVRQPYTGIHEREVLRISVSIGSSRWPEHGDNTDALMQAADRAMYRCKHGNNQKPVMAGG